MILAIITLVSALLISVTSAYFSVTGLGALFSASFVGVVIMASSIELGKLVGAAWLKFNWANKSVSLFHKLYLSVIVIMCMSITSLGTFSYLSKAHFDQKAPIQNDLVQIDVKETQLTDKKEERSNAYKQLEELNKTIVPGARQFSLEKERRAQQEYIKQLNVEILDLNEKLLTNKQNISSVDLELGPVKYLADLIFDDVNSNIDRTIQILILCIMFVFDPLAVVLLISAVISFRQVANNKTKVIVEEIVEVQEPVTNQNKGLVISPSAKPGEHIGS